MSRDSLTAETGEILDQMRKERKAAFRAGPMKENVRKLMSAGCIVFEYNNGEHLLITCENGKMVDYWPSTQKWIQRKGTARGSSTKSLLGFIKSNRWGAPRGVK